MKFAIELSRGERRNSIENPTVPVSQTTEFMAFFGLDTAKLPRVTIDSALTVPAVAAAVAFLSRTLAALPLHAYTGQGDDRKRLNDDVEAALHDAWNDDTDAYEARQYFWQQVFTGGRGLAWIDRGDPLNLWPMVPAKVAIKRIGGQKVYRYEGRDYPASEVIDVPFMLKADQLAHYGPIALGTKAIQLALAMNDYASNFFAGGGVPPLALVGPLPQGKDALQRAMNDVHGAIDAAKASSKPVFPLPPGHELKPVGFDPDKGQMEQARLFQVQEIARIYQMPPAFLQDLSRGTFANVEQQDLHLVKHLIGQWAKAFESELTLKIYGRGKARAGRYIEHNLDGLQRGDFKSRTEGMARAIQTGQLTPNEARGLDNRPRHENPVADELLVQGATVVLGTTAPALVPAPRENGDDDVENDDA